jgi:hypothetical protein
MRTATRIDQAAAFWKGIEAMGVSRGGAGELREQERGWTAVGEGLSTLKASIPDQSALGFLAMA